MVDLKNVGVKILTIGQYLRPSLAHLEVIKFYEVAEFEHLKKMALDIGFEYVASGQW